MLRLRIAVSVLCLLTLLIVAGCGGSSNSLNGNGSSSGGSGSGGSGSGGSGSGGSGSGGSGSGSGSGGSGSGGSSGGGNPAPTITSFAVTPTIVGPGQFANFSWASANATAFTVTPAINQDDQTLPLSSPAYPYNTNGLTQTTTFSAVASTGSTQSQPSSVTLTIVPVTLTASPMTVPAGSPVTLTYGGPNNGSSWALVTVGNNNPIPLPAPACSGNSCTGTYTTGALSSNTTFQVAVSGPVGGQAYSPQVTVTVESPTTLTFSAQPVTVPPGGAVTLSWQTTNASAVSIDHGVGNVIPVNMGSYCCVHPTQTTTYTATGTSIYPDSPPVTATATVTVSTGGLSNLNHIIFMLQENRAFDNYFGVLAQYRVNHQPPIPGAQLSDVNDLHTLPSGLHHQESPGTVIRAVPR